MIPMRSDPLQRKGVRETGQNGPSAPYGHKELADGRERVFGVRRASGHPDDAGSLNVAPPPQWASRPRVNMPVSA